MSPTREKRLSAYASDARTFVFPAISPPAPMAPDNSETLVHTAPRDHAGLEAHSGYKAHFLDALGEAVIGTDAEGRIVSWNRAATRLYGWRPEEVIGSNILDITPSDEMRESAARIMAALRRGRSWTGEFRTRHKDGRVFPVVVTNAPVHDSDGQLMGVVGISRDISGQREAETALQASEERLDLVRRAVQSVIWELDPLTGRMEWSDALEDVFGYSPAQVEPTADWWLARVHADDRVRIEAAFRAFLEDEHHFWTEEYRFQRADGTYASVFDRAYAAPCETGEKGRIAGALVDLTERRQLQDERRLLAQAGMILDLSLDYEATLPTLTRLVASDLADFCLVHLTPGTHVQPFTTATHRHAGFQQSLDQIATRLTPRPPEGSITARVLHQREPLLIRNVPRELRSASGVPAPLQDLVLELGPSSLLILPIMARSDVLGFMILGSTGLRSPYGETELRLGEELARRIGTAVDHARMYEAEQLANRAKADFLAVMSHELRTPLTAVLGYTDLLAEEVSGRLNDRQKQQVQRIRAGTDRLHRLMESILVYVRLETGQERPRRALVELGELLERVREIVGPRAAEDQVDFRIEAEDLPARITTDPDRFLQVLLALLTNALKFAGRGSIVLRVSRRAEALEIDVADTGPGIPEEHQPYVFNAFWQVEQPSTRRAGGAGLGLSVARRMARLLDGDVIIAASSPAGTTFRFHLPTGPTA